MKEMVLMALHLSTLLTLHTYLSIDKVLRVYGLILLIIMVQFYG